MSRETDVEAPELAVAVRESEVPSEQINVATPPGVVLAEAKKAAVALQEVISAKPKKVMMNGEQYLEFEDWQTVGHFYGITAKEDGDADYVELGSVAGFRASALAVHASGRVLGRATAFCLNDEEKWRSRPKYEWHMVLKNGQTAPEDESQKSDWVWEDNPNKPGKKRPKRQRVNVGEESVPLFQLASMAQTRASAKALRNVLAWVVVLAGYRPTPSEELDVEHEPQTKRITKAQQKELWQLAESRSKTVGIGDKEIMRSVLEGLEFASTADIPAADFDRAADAIANWDPPIEPGSDG